jgi:DNA-binding transcriptional LysR family regulator
MDQLRALQVFVRVADCGSFAAAARAMDLAPAVVTRTVADLERHLGARLFHRSTRRVALTLIGERYLERTRAILRDIDDATALAREAQAEPSGALRVLAPPYFAAHQLVRRLPRFFAQHPQIWVDIDTAWPVEAPDEKHDLTIIVGRGRLDGDFVARRLASAEIVTCAAPSYLALHGRPTHPRHLASHRVIVPPVLQPLRSITFRRSADGEEVSVTPLPAALGTMQLELNYAAALSGVGIVGLASYAAAAALCENRLERVLPGWSLGELSIWACMPSRKHVPASTRAFIDFLLAEFGGDDAEPWLAAESPCRSAQVEMRAAATA